MKRLNSRGSPEREFFTLADLVGVLVAVRFELLRRRRRRRGARRRRRGARRGGTRRRDGPPPRNGGGRWRRGGLRRAPHLEHDLHVVRGAPAAYSPVEVVAGGRRDEVVVVPGEELQTAGLWRKRPERDGEVHQLVGLIADGDDARVGVRYPARVVLVFRYVVDYVLFHFFVAGPWDVHGAN